MALPQLGNVSTSSRLIRFYNKLTPDVMLFQSDPIFFDRYSTTDSIKRTIDEMIRTKPALTNYGLEDPPDILLGGDRKPFNNENLARIGPRNIYVYVTLQTGTSENTPLVMGGKLRKKKTNKKKTNKKKTNKKRQTRR